MASSPPDKPVRVPRGYALLAGICLILACGCAHATVDVRIASLSLPGVTLADVHAVAGTGPDGAPEVELHAARVSVPALGWRNVALRATGEPRRDADGTWKFVGHVNARGAPGGALSASEVTIAYDPAGHTLAVNVVQGSGSLDALMPTDQVSHVELKLARVPLAWLRGLVAAAWPDGRLSGGSISGRAALDLSAGGTRVSGRAEIAGANLDSRSGTIAAQDLGALGNFRIELGRASASMMFDGNLHGGQMLLGPVFANLPSHATNLHVAGSVGPAGIRIGSLDYDDRDALRVAGSLAFDRKGDLASLDLKRIAAVFPTAYTRYGTTLVQTLTGLQRLDTAGSVTGSLRLTAGGLRALDLHADDLSLHGDGGLAVTGLKGGVDWRAGASRPATTLAWNGLALDRLVFGPGQAGLQDRDGTLTLRAPVTTTFFGGSFQLARMAWRPDATREQRLAAAFSVTAVDLASLCKALGWPAFQGKLGGAVPDLRYRGDELVFSGGLSMHVFDGSVSVTDLQIRRPFGASPEVSTDIDLQQLDLAQLTHVFDFGQISGRLDGAIHDLTLVDWKPTAFTARLTADGGGKISQHAIQSLTRVGGGGIAGGLQGMALRLFKTFHYAKIGLGCTLADGVCTMSGIVPDPNPDQGGYTIVEGSGLPRITVIGHQRSVDWATLLARLEAATSGEGPVIK